MNKFIIKCQKKGELPGEMPGESRCILFLLTYML